MRKWTDKQLEKAYYDGCKDKEKEILEIIDKMDCICFDCVDDDLRNKKKCLNKEIDVNKLKQKIKEREK